ncbi:extracellular matrix/biofilm biosynthesis regulator RemA family protein [Indiicoccus explosivorum]|uniref:extracellular matrix/biofilm biosynthesis regulator RemA family protein n=1 Tax=Indiicoccus explosivorum TaxID=1917864 RepID=UPI000B4453B1|nr:extracellular matrix/biofilm biosynthesis regulator RemA family protein [Indiicoccus explosivorum]
MAAKFISLGSGSAVAADRIISILSPDSAPAKRLIQEARTGGLLIDATYGKKTRSIFVMDSDHIVISALSAETAITRSGENDDDTSEG